LASNTALNLLIRRQEKQSITKEELLKILGKLDRMDKYLAQLIDEIKKKRSLQKKEMMPFCLQSKDMIAQFYSMMKEDIQEELSNMRLAQLNKLAYNNILQRSLLKKINKRIGINAGML
jgi:chromosome segregation and condensation protein ScpB